MANEAQIENWAGASGHRWVGRQAFYDRMLGPFNEPLLSAAAVAPDSRILDVGCGNGTLTLQAAGIAGALGSVVGVDISTPMLANARDRAAAAGAGNVTFELADAQTHAFSPASFDRMISRFGVMFFDDPAAAFANVYAALRTGGRLAFVCWQDVASNEWLSVARDALAAHLPALDRPAAYTPGPLAFADPERVRRLLTGAGFTDVYLRSVATDIWLAPTVDETVTYLLGSQVFSSTLAGADPDAVTRATAQLTDVLAGRADRDGVTLGAQVWLVTAKRP